MEAVIGAIYLDGGFSAVQERITQWYEPLIASLSSAASHKDPKTVLQEYLQSRHLPLPVYDIEALEGEAHRQIFVVSCQAGGMKSKTQGKGTSRRRAEQEAALAMLGLLKE